MKRYIVFVIALCFSCTSSDETPPENGVLLKKIIETFEGSEPQTTVYHYNGNKLVEAVNEDDDHKLVYSYAGNLLTRISYRNLGGTEYTRHDLTYDDSQRLIKHSSKNSWAENPNYIQYTHNADGTVLAVSHFWDDFELEYSIDSQKIFFENGNVIKTENYLPAGIRTSLYSYDDNPNPYRNIRGFDKLLTFDLSVNNCISQTVTAPDGSTLVQSGTAFTYDQGAYPVSSFRTGIGVGNDKTTAYFYQ